MAPKTQAEKRWKIWSNSRPIDWVTKAFYPGVLIVYAYFAVSGTYDEEVNYPGGIAILGGLLFLIGLDRLEYCFHHPQPPKSVSFIFKLLYLGLMVIFLYLIALASFIYIAVCKTCLTDHPYLIVATIFFFSLLLLGLNRLEYWYPQEKRFWYVSVVFFLLRLGVIFVFSLADGLGFFEDSIIILSIFLAIFLVVGKSYGLTGLIWMGYLVWRVRHVEELVAGIGTQNEINLNVMLLISLFLIIAFIFAIAYLAKQERTARLQSEKLLQELEKAHQQLQMYAEQVGELATIEERNRLARDIHDGLGHYMTVINVQLEKAIAYREIDTREADEAIITAKSLAGQALKDIRRSVKTLRETTEPFLLSQALSELVDNIGQGHFLVDLQIEGDETGYTRQSLITLYRAAQEGLTNIQKHAYAKHVTIQIKLDEHQGILTISDDGCGFEPSELNSRNDSHYGLTGLQERLELIRGSFRLDSSPGEGTKLFVTVPKNPLAIAINDNE